MYFIQTQEPCWVFHQILSVNKLFIKQFECCNCHIVREQLGLVKFLKKYIRELLSSLRQSSF